MRVILIACMVGVILFAFSGSASAYTEGLVDNYFGFYAGGSGGTQNSFFGGYTGDVNTGNSNTFIGYSAGFKNTTGSNNTFLGNVAGNSNDTGYENTFIGSFAGERNDTGYSNTFVGTQAGRFNSTGYENTFIGKDAGWGNTEGNMNVFIGFHAGGSETGSNRLYIENSNDSNPLIYGEFDNDLLRVNGTFEATGNIDTNGVYKIGGTQILKADNINTFLGDGAGVSNTTGSSNTFIGQSAGFTNNSGKWNTFLGLNAGYNSTTGSWNTFIGEGAGFSNTTGYDNTFLGEGAGFSNQEGNMNVFLGFNAGYYEMGSNRLYIENSTDSNPLIYGEFDNNIVKINGKLGVGTNPTSSQLTVGGVIESTGGGIKFSDGSTITSANNINADLLDGWHSSAFAQSSHSHAGVDITSGTVAETYIDTLIARDSEVTTAVDAHATRTDNPHSVTAAQVGASDVSHNHDADYINANSSDTMNGDLLVYGIVDIDQDLYVVGNIYAESDARSKKDIQPINSSLNKIQNIQGVKYKWERQETDSNEGHYGVIAQEVEKVLPEIVTTGKNGNKKVAYMELIPVLIEAVKEQQSTIRELKEQNREMLKKIHELEKEIKFKGSLASAIN